MSLKLLTARSEIGEPVTIEEAKAHCRIEHNRDDAAVGRWIRAARELIEQQTHRQLMTAQWMLTLDDFPSTTVLNPFQQIILPFGEIQLVGKIEYLDTEGAWQELEGDTDYLADENGDFGRIVPAYSKIWPPVRRQINAVRITFTCGYGTAEEVPDQIKGIALNLVSWKNENRDGDFTSGASRSWPTDVRHAAATSLADFAIMAFA